MGLPRQLIVQPTPVAVATIVLLALLVSVARSAAQESNESPRWIDQLSGVANKLDRMAARTVPPDSRLRRQTDRLLDRVDQIADARQAPDERQLQAIHDSATVLKSELLDAATNTHPERLGQLEQMLGLAEVIRSQAIAGIHTDLGSIEQVTEQIAASAEETAESLSSAIEELSGEQSETAGQELDQVIQRIRSLRDSVAPLTDDGNGNNSEVAIASANQALVVRAQLLVLAITTPDMPRGALQAARRAALHLEGQLTDYALLAAQQMGGASPTALGRLLQVTETLMDDLSTLFDATPERDREVVQAMIADARRAQNDIRNLTRNSEYAPRQRLDDIHGRITRVIEQTDAHAAEVTDRTSGLLRVVQADLVASRELSLMAAAEQLGLYDLSANRLLPQMANVDLSAEEQLGAKLTAQQGRISISQVSRGGPAAQAGLRRGDLLIAANDRELQTDVDLENELESARRRSAIRLVVERNGERVSRQISLGSTPRHANRSSETEGNR